MESDNWRNILESIPLKTINQVHHVQRDIRERAVCAITKSLNSNSQEDIRSFYAVAFEFLERDDVLWALWYLETVGKIGNLIPIEIIETVLKWAFSTREGIVQSNLPDKKKNKKLHSLDSGIRAIFEMIQEHPELENEKKLIFLLGAYEEDCGNLEVAKTHYLQVANLGDVDGYLAIGEIYEWTDDFDGAYVIYHWGYQKENSPILLGKMIRTLCKMKHYDEAITYHEKFKHLFGKNKVPPFIIYRESVQCDADLFVLESYMAKYITEWTLMPSESLANLSKSAGVYIRDEVSAITKQIARIDRWGTRDEERQELVFRRLRLIQIDIFTLVHSRFIEIYLTELKKMLSDTTHGNIEIFFGENPSSEVMEEFSHRGNNPWESLDKISIPSIHLDRMKELFLQHDLYTLQSRDIPNTQEKIQKKDEEEEHYHRNILVSLKDQKDFFDSIHPKLQKLYTDFIKSFDGKYGTFYRRHLQATVLKDNSEKLLEWVLWEFDDIAYFYWIERLISGRFLTDDFDEIIKLVNQYHLDDWSIEDTILLSSLLGEHNPEVSIALLSGYPNALYNPYCLYLISKYYHLLPPEKRVEVLWWLSEIARDEYGYEDFFHIARVVYDDEDITDPQEQEFVLLMQGNVFLMTHKNTQEGAMKYFLSAAELGISHTGLILAGYLASELDKYDQAFLYYEQALLSTETTDESGIIDEHMTGSIEVINLLLLLSLTSKRPNKFIQYGTYALKRWYNIQVYLLSNLVLQGKVEETFRRALHMISQWIQPIDRPPGTIEKLFEIIQKILSSKEESRELDRQKIHASFIDISLVSEKPSQVIVHWEYVVSLLNSGTDAEIHDKIRDALPSIIPEDDFIDEELAEHSPSDQSLQYLMEHWLRLIQLLAYRMSEADDTLTQEEYQKTIYTLNSSVVNVMKRFPDADGYIEIYLGKVQWILGEEPEEELGELEGGEDES